MGRGSRTKVGSTSRAALRSIRRRPARLGDLTAELTNLAAVGAVTESSARIWVRSQRLAPLELRLWPLSDPASERRVAVPQRHSERTDHTMSFQYPGDWPSEPALDPLTRHGFRIVYADDGTGVDEGTFETAPTGDDEAAERFTFAFMSCNQPYKNDGSIDNKAVRMLNLIEPTLEAYGAKYVLLVGDQMYADYPKGQSLFDPRYFRTIHDGEESSILECSEDDIRMHYHRRYRIQWNLPQFTSFQSRHPTYCMLDDHEIVDNWGSTREHLEPRWQRLARAARRAYFDYQGTRTLPWSEELPGSFHYGFRYGRSATFVADMRSQRSSSNVSNRIFGEDQFQALEAFLAAHDDCPVLFVVLTVPTVYVPDWMANLGVRILGEGNDVSDRWGWRKNTPDRDRLLRILRRHLESRDGQKIVLLSGDVHLGLALKMSWTDPKHTTLYQFVSSAVTNSLDTVEYVAAKLAAHAMPHLHHDGHELELSLLEPLGGEQRNPFSGLNLGLVDVQASRSGPSVRFRLITHGERDHQGPRVAFDSGPL